MSSGNLFSEQSNRICELLQHHPAEVRIAEGYRLCGGDEELWEEVRALLSASEEECIGAFRIIREIGRGGMGKVYLAERREDFAQEVAIKLFFGDASNPAMFLRFRRERQILAGLKHKHIVRLHEGGSTPLGRPYLVTEYVNEAATLSDYVNSVPTSVTERLRLFLQICEGVSYAHDRTVIHRDLTPQNVLITRQGQVKILDFGLATMLDTWTDDVGDQLTTGPRPWGTPGYASPEQMEGKSTRHVGVDVFALGVILYELLARVPAYARTPSMTWEQLRQIVCSSRPDPPSRVRRRAGEIAESRGLAGDLDAIVSKAMERDPKDRYANVSALAEDIEAYLDSRPIRIRRHSVAYRAGKFVRRFKWQLGAAACITVLLLALIAIQTGAARRQIMLRMDAEKAATEALRERVNVQTQLVSKYLQQGDVANAAALLANTIRDDRLNEFPLNRLEYRFWQPRLSSLFDLLHELSVPAVVNWRNRGYFLDQEQQPHSLGVFGSYLWAMSRSSKFLLTVEPSGKVRVHSFPDLRERMILDSAQPTGFRIEHVFQNRIVDQFIVVGVDEDLETAAHRSMQLLLVNAAFKVSKFVESVDYVSTDCQAVKDFDETFKLELDSRGNLLRTGPGVETPLFGESLDSGSCGSVKSSAKRSVQLSFPTIIPEEKLWSVELGRPTESQNRFIENRDGVRIFLSPEGGRHKPDPDPYVDYIVPFEYRRVEYGSNQYIVGSGSDGSAQCGLDVVAIQKSAQFLQIWSEQSCGENEGFVAFSNDSRYAVLSGSGWRGSPPVRVFDFKAAKPLLSPDALSGAGPDSSAIRFRTDDRQFVANVNGELIVFDINEKTGSYKIFNRIRPQGAFDSGHRYDPLDRDDEDYRKLRVGAFSSRGVLIVLNDTQLGGIDSSTGRMLWTTSFDLSDGGGVTLSHDQDIAAVYTPKQVQLFTADTGVPLTSLLSVKALFPRRSPPKIESLTMDKADVVNAWGGGYVMRRREPLGTTAIVKSLGSIEVRTGIDRADGQTPLVTLPNLPH